MTLLGIEYMTLIRIVDVIISVLTAAFSTIFVLAGFAAVCRSLGRRRLAKRRRGPRGSIPSGGCARE